MTVYRVRAYLPPTQYMYHLALVYSGLFELAHAGMADLRITQRLPWRSDPEDATTVGLSVSGEGSGERDIAIDLLDRSDVFNHSALAHCTLYFKRNFYPAHLDALPESLRIKVHPFGLNFACRTAYSTRRILTSFAPRLAGSFLRYGLFDRKTLREEVAKLAQYVSSPEISVFEEPPETLLEPTVVFQTRVWQEVITPDSPVEINDGRANLVRALQKGLGSRFVGGLVATPFALEHYPDAVSSASGRRSSYIEMSKRSLVGIYTRGLHHSLAFKLPEYLAASKCIVSDPQRNQLPEPLVPLKHYLVFRTPDECVSLCEDILANPALARAMRQAAWQYYREHVRPDAHIRQLLERACRLG